MARALDALRAAAEYHTLLFENDSVRVLDTHVPPGRTVPLHTHRWPAVLYIQSWSDFVRRDGDGTVLADSRTGGGLAAGMVAWSGPLGPHRLQNVGTAGLWVLSIELKVGPADEKDPGRA